jgi:branched-chain amino acid transport system ATP-binding protein
VLELRGLRAGHGRVAVVRELDLTVAAGEVVALLGPNGAGKTTTLLTAAGLLRPLGGDVLVDGSSVVGRRPQRLARDGVSLVPDDRGLFPSLTVAEHLRLVHRSARRRARTGGDGAGGTSDVQAEVLEWFPQLRPLLGRPAGLLSGGEQQMLALGRALATRPRVLLVDELSLGLAPIVVESLLPVLRDVATRTGCGVLVVEQHAPMALAVADGAVVMRHGEAVASGSADEVRSDWDRLLASYLG